MTEATQRQATSLARKLESLSQAQRDRVAATATAQQARIDAPSMKLSQTGKTLKIGFDHDSSEIATLLQMADIGSTDSDFHLGLVGQIACIGSQGQSIDAANANFVVAVVRSVKPRDELEAMLATQMGAIHAATMMMARRLNLVDNIPQQDSAERALNKLARTFVTQMEALKRYRTGGQQKVTVEHVTVNAGGQAIVGAVSNHAQATKD